MRQMFIAAMLAVSLCLLGAFAVPDSTPGTVATSDQVDHSPVTVAAIATDAVRMPETASAISETRSDHTILSEPTNRAGSTLGHASPDALAVPWRTVT